MSLRARYLPKTCFFASHVYVDVYTFSVLLNQPASPGGLNSIAYQLAGVGMVEEAMLILQTAIELYPQEANLYDSLGEFQLKKGEKAKALASYQKALATNPRAWQRCRRQGDGYREVDGGKLSGESCKTVAIPSQYSTGAVATALKRAELIRSATSSLRLSWNAVATAPVP